MRLEDKTKVRHHCNVPTEPWVVSAFVGGYVQPDGSVGKLHKYDTKEEAEAAELLFQKGEEKI